MIDTSALIAFLNGEPTAPRLGVALAGAPYLYLSAGSLIEAGIVAERERGEEGGRELDLLLYRLRVQVVSVTADHAEIARSAFRRFSKGRHPAGLNFGDCFAYALAMALGEPLLFVRDDFARTDVSVAPY